MKRLVSVFLVLCMMLSCVAFGETLDGAQGEIMNEVSDVASDEVQTPDEPTQAPVNEDDIVLPDMDDDISILPSDDVNGPDPYRELVLLQPTDLIGTTLSETSVRIGWGSVAFATQYDVYRKLGGETSYTLLGSVPNNRLYYEDTNVTPGQAVYYRVRAVNVSYDGEQAKYVYSPDSQTLSYMTLAKPKLQDPRGLGADTIRLNWSSVSGAQTYEVQMSTNATSGFTTVRTDLTGTLCNATGLKKATGYYFRVRAVRVFSSGEKFYSEYSNVGCGTPMDRPELTVVQSGNNALLSWPASSGATGYIIYRKTGASGSYTLLAKTGAVTSFVDASINLGEAARQAFDSCVLKPADLRRKQPITGYAVTLPKADTQKKDKKKKNDADAVGTKSVYLDSLMLEKNTRKERRTRIVHTKSRGAGERKFRQEVVIDHAGWMKEFNRYVADSLRYPEDARLEKLQGEIQLTVRLNRKGLPARIKLIQRLSPSCNREAIRLVEEYPGKWENTEKEILLTIPFKLPVTE